MRSQKLQELQSPEPLTVDDRLTEETLVNRGDTLHGRQSDNTPTRLYYAYLRGSYTTVSLIVASCLPSVLVNFGSVYDILR